MMDKDDLTFSKNENQFPPNLDEYVNTNGHSTHIDNLSSVKHTPLPQRNKVNSAEHINQNPKAELPKQQNNDTSKYVLKTIFDEKLSALDTRINQLIIINEQQTVKIGQLNLQVKLLTTKNDDLTHQLDSIKHECEQNHINVDTYDCQKCFELKSVNDKLLEITDKSTIDSSIITSLKESNSNYELEIITLRDKIESMLVINRNNESEMIKLRKSHSMVQDNTKDTNQSLKDEIISLKNELAHTKTELNRVTSENVSISNLNTAHETTISKIQLEIESLTSINKQLNNDLLVANQSNLGSDTDISNVEQGILRKLYVSLYARFSKDLAGMEYDSLPKQIDGLVDFVNIDDLISAYSIRLLSGVDDDDPRFAQFVKYQSGASTVPSSQIERIASSLNLECVKVDDVYSVEYVNLLLEKVIDKLSDPIMHYVFLDSEVSHTISSIYSLQKAKMPFLFHHGPLIYSITQSFVRYYNQHVVPTFGGTEARVAPLADFVNPVPLVVHENYDTSASLSNLSSH